jgi:Uma2 family endonuclease
MMTLIVFLDGMPLALDRVQERTMYDERTEDRSVDRPASRDSRLTYDDFLLFPDDGMRHEIIDGEHYVTACPNTRHQILLGRLYFEVEQCLRQRPGVGQVFLSPFDVIFTKWDVVEPDLLFIASDQIDILTDKNVQGPPALVIEIASPGTRHRDEGIKLRLFERGGVREYWLVDPERDRITVWRRQADDSFPRVAELSREQHDVLTTPLLAELRMPLVQLFS